MTAPTTIALPDLATLRAHFPALGDDTTFFDNAGGSQVPLVVADAIRDYLLNSYVQLGAGYPMSERCTKLVDDAHEFINLFMNGTRAGKVILGASSTQLIFLLVDCYRKALRPGPHCRSYKIRRFD